MNYFEIKHYYGSAEKAGLALGIRRQAVHAWLRKGVPLGRQYEIQAITGGALRVTEKRRKLRRME